MDINVFLPWIAGVVGFPIINFVKSKLGAESKYAVIVAIAVSVVLAAVVLFITGGFTGENFLANVAIVFSTATAVYKLL